MKNYNMILAETKVSPKVSTLPSDKTDKYEYLTGEEILFADQSKMTEQAYFTYSLYLFLVYFRKSFEKTNKNNSVSAEETNRCYHR